MNNKVEPVKIVVSVKLILDNGVTVDELRRYKAEYGSDEDYKECLQLNYSRDSSGSKNSYFVEFEGFGVLTDDDAAWLMDMDRFYEVHACRIGAVAEESKGGCTLDLEFIDYEATRKKQRDIDGIANFNCVELSEDGLELRRVPCDIASFDFPMTVKRVADDAFQGCGELVDIEIPGHVETIGMFAFGRCKKLKKVVIQSGCRHIGRAAFAECEELQEVSLPDTVKVIEPLAFSGDRKLVKVRMPANLDEFGFSVFSDCPAFPDKMVVSGDGTQLLLCCGSEAELVVPDGVEEIADQTFRECVNLRRLTLPDSVYMVGDDSLPILLEEVRLRRKLDLRHSGLPDRARVVFQESTDVVSLCETARKLKNACVSLLANEKSEDGSFEPARNSQELRDMLFDALGAMVHGENLIRKALGHSIYNKCMEGVTDNIEQERYGVKYGADFSESVRLAVCDARRLLHSMNELLDKDSLTRFMKEEHGHATICEIHHVLSCGQIQIDAKWGK